MRSTFDGPPSPLGRGLSPGSNNNNNNGGENSDNSGCQYALCALGVGLVALGIVMIVWSVVPSEAAGNNSSNIGGEGDPGSKKNKVSSVAFVLVGCGVVMLLLSLGVGLMNKRREQQRLQQAQNHGGVAVQEQEEEESAEEQAQRFAVPSYEEAVGSGQYPVRQSNHRPSSSQLPSYDDLVKVDGLEYEYEGSEVINNGSQPAPSSTSNCRPGKNTSKLLPIKIRRIKSEKLHLKNIDHSRPAAGISLEPLTPPPQYEDKVPSL